MYIFFWILSRGGSRVFSGGGGGGGGGWVRIFKKIFENFVDLFFRSTELIFQALPERSLVPVWPNFLRRRQTFEKTVKKRHF